MSDARVVVIDNKARCWQSHQHEGRRASPSKDYLFKKIFRLVGSLASTGALAGSIHSFKYRLAYVVDGECVLRFDNETGKGDHRHFGGKKGHYAFSTPEKLIAEFQREIARWNNENGYA